MKVSVVIPSRRQNVLTLNSVENIKDYVGDINIVREGSTGEAMNIGAKRSKSETLLFLDDDVKFTRELFLNALHKLENNARALVGLKTSDGMSCMFMLIRKQDFFDVGGIVLPNYYLDTEFGFRAEKHGIKRILHPLSSVKHLHPTPSGFWSRRQRLLSFHSCYVYLHHRDMYTENYGKWRNIRLRNFVFRPCNGNLLKAIYMTSIMVSGVTYYGVMLHAWRQLQKIARFLFYKLKVYTLFWWHQISYKLPFTDYIRIGKMKKLLSNLQYEPAVSKALKDLKGNIFVDVGANIGYYSILASKNFRWVYAFEPFPETYRKLCKYLKKFNVSNVVAIDKAVMETDSQQNFGLFDYIIQKFDPTTHIQLGLPEETHVPLRTVKVETVALASFFKDLEIDLVKVDVEGNEWKVLEGAEPIMHNIKAWIVELHHTNRKLELEHYLSSFGYSTRWLDDNHIFAKR